MLTAITRGPSGRLADCELSFVERQAIDVERARAQHRDYQAALRAAGVRVIELPALDRLPDSSFVEDTAVVLDELAIMAPLGSGPFREGRGFRTVAVDISEFEKAEADLTCLSLVFQTT